MISSSTLVFLEYQDPFAEFSFESCLSCIFLVWAQNFSSIQWIVNFNGPALELQVCSNHLNIGQDRLNIALIV